MPELGLLLADAVLGGASVGWPGPLDAEAAAAWWLALANRVDAGDVIVLAARAEGHLVGTVQLRLADPPNGRHRAELAKLLVLQSHRRQGLGAALVRRAEEVAIGAGRTLLILDTLTGSPAENLYRKLGWVPLGVLPGYALVAGGTLEATSFFYRDLSGLSLPA